MNHWDQLNINSKNIRLRGVIMKVKLHILYIILFKVFDIILFCRL